MRERKFLLWKKNITLDYLEKLHDVYEDLVTCHRFDNIEKMGKKIKNHFKNMIIIKLFE